MKHNPAVWYADAAAQPDFPANDRAMSPDRHRRQWQSHHLPLRSTNTKANSSSYCYTYSRGAWDAGLQNYATANGITSWWTGNTQPWTSTSSRQDLATGNVGNLNFIVPDQDDDMHNTGVEPRADAAVYNIVTKIQSSPLWSDSTKRVAIVVTFDEGESAETACCGWNPERSGDGAAQPVAVAANGTRPRTSPV